MDLEQSRSCLQREQKQFLQELRKWRTILKKTGAYKIWQIIYPIGIYYVVSSVIYFFVTMFLGGEKQTYMLRQLICAAGTIPVILSFYRADRQFETVVYGADEQMRGQTIRNIV